MKDGSVFKRTESATVMHSYQMREFVIGKLIKQLDAFGKLPRSADKIIELALNIEKVSNMWEYTSLLQILTGINIIIKSQ